MTQTARGLFLLPIITVISTCVLIREIRFAGSATSWDNGSISFLPTKVLSEFEKQMLCPLDPLSLPVQHYDHVPASPSALQPKASSPNGKPACRPKPASPAQSLLMSSIIVKPIGLCVSREQLLLSFEDRTWVLICAAECRAHGSTLKIA